MWVHVGIVLGVSAAVVIGLVVALPATRTVIASVEIAAPAETILGLLQRPERQTAWRRDLVAVERTGPRTWLETTRSGDRIHFSRDRAAPSSTLRLTFAGDRGFQGEWTARITPVSRDTARLDVRETVTVRALPARVLSYIFFRPGAFTRAYLADLERAVRGRETAA
jgi:hypothetical protein